MLLGQNTTFAILDKSSDADSWHKGMTEATAETYSSINDSPICHVSSVDEALKNCHTDYLIILSAGYCILRKQFFDSVSKILELKENIVLAEIIMEDDYCTLSTDCMVFDMTLWRDAGSPAFKGTKRNGPDLVADEAYRYVKNPALVKAIKDRFNNITPYCAENGGIIIMTQLERFEKAQALRVDKLDGYLFSKRSPVSSLIAETKYLTEVYPILNDTVNLFSNRDINIPQNMEVDYIVISADGQWTYEVLNRIKAKNIIIWSSSEDKLRFQRIIFDLKRTMNAENVAGLFFGYFPTAKLEGDIKSGRSYLYHVVPRGEITYKKINPIGYDLLSLLDSIDTNATLVVDLADTFTNPRNYFRIGKDTINEFAKHVKSCLGGRRAPAYIMESHPITGEKSIEFQNVKPPILEIEVNEDVAISEQFF